MIQKYEQKYDLIRFFVVFKLHLNDTYNGQVPFGGKSRYRDYNDCKMPVSFAFFVFE